MHRNGKTTLVQPHPISIDPDILSPRPCRSTLPVRNAAFAIGSIYTTNSCSSAWTAWTTQRDPGAIQAVGRLLELHPDLAGTFTFVQVGAPSRVHIPAYRRLNEELSELADDINWRHGSDEWRPIVFLNEHYGPEQVYSRPHCRRLRRQLIARR
mgnify:CR=1 FL=1